MTDDATALVISDLHLGSIASIMPPTVALDPVAGAEPAVILANPLQRIYYDFYEKVVTKVGRVDCCIVLGDSIDGVDRHGEGYGVWTSNRRVQCRAAVDLLSMVKTDTYYGVQGTGYHVLDNTSADCAVIDALGGEFATDLAITLGEARIHANHFIGASRSLASKGTAPISEIFASAAYEDYIGKFDCIIRGHRHDWYDFRRPEGHIIGVPSWKARDPFASKGGLAMPAQVIGAVVLHAEGHDVRGEEFLLKLTREHQFREVTVPVRRRRGRPGSGP